MYCIVLQQNLLMDVIVPPAIKQNLLSESDIDNEIIVVDGGDNGNPSIRLLMASNGVV